jgi:beta-lactamase class A
VVTADLFDGFVAISLVTTEPRLLAAQAVPGSGAPFPFAAALQSYLATRSGRVSVAVFNAKTGATYSYNSGTQFVTASIVKVAILGTLLRQAQDARRSLTSTERSLATVMIEQSDNAAATSLWNEVGRGPGVGAFMSKVGMPSTIPGSDGLWGLTSTNTPDQVRLVRTVAYPNTVLSDASRGYAESLMRAVTPSQKWGVSGGVPASGTVALKNGWLPRTGGWVINSIGHVRGGTHDYVIAVLTSGNSSMSYGITTVEHVSAMVWQRLPSASFGDFSGDGWSDLIARQTSTGSLLLYRGNGTGFRVSLRIGVGWNGMDAITRFGDFNRDGHEDVIARESATGDLWLYPGTGSGFGSRLKIGIGWNGMREITPVGDVNGDGYPDVLAVKTSTGFMSLYPGRGTGFSGPSQLGPGWNAMTELAGVGDFNRDGHVDLVARNTATGDLWLYRGAGAGFSSGLQVGRGWNGMRDLVGVGDFDRDGFNDLIAVRSATGNLYRYPGRGTSFGQGLVVGNGWTGMQPLL